MNTPEDDPEETLKGINAADLLARGLESAKAATGNPQAWQPPTPEELAVLLPQYEIESLLGRGGMGAVYRGKQAALDRAVAIKLLPAELAADAEFMSRFQREARTLAKLQHPGIVAVHDFGQTSAGHLYFVMEFVNGTDLARLIHGPGINPVQALEVITQICDALQYAHGQGVIHRDIKPANVLINTEGRAKLADFGLARPTSEETASLTRSNVVMGTPDYMAPEQMAGNADHRADLYALGVMLYEMLTGQTPRGAWAPPSQRVQVDVRLDQVVVRALQQDPAMRYQQASEIKTDVDVIRTTPLPKAGKAKAKLASEAPGQRTTPLPKAKKPVNRVAWAAAIVLPLLAVVGWWTAQNQKTPSSPASAVPWQRVERTAEQWAKTGQTLKDGWVHSPNKSILLFDRLTPALATSQFAFRTKIIFDDKESRLSLANTNGGGSQMRAVAFWPNKQNVSTHNPAATQRHPATVAPGEEAYVEILVAGDKAYTRFNHGGVVEVDLSPLIPWEQGYLLSDKSYSLRDIEYAILDGIPDPLKALGWEVPPTPVPQAQTLPWLLVEAKGKNWDLGKLTKKDSWVEMTEGVAWTKPDRAFKAIAFRVHYQWKGDGSLSLKRLNNTQPSVSLTLWPKELKLFTRSLTPDLKQADQNTSFTEPLRQGHEGTLELAVVGERMLARLDGRLMFVGDQPGLPPTAFIEVNGENVRVRDFQYAILDGIPDPLKALGWEVPQENVVSSNSLWQKAVWGDENLPNVFSDGWFTVGDELKGSGLFGPGNKRITFGDGAVRAQVRFGTTPHKFKPSVGLWLRLPHDQAIEFLISESELIASKNRGRIVFDTPFRPGDVELIEAAAVGDTFIVRFKGKELRVEYREAGRSGQITFHGRNFSVKDVEYTILDGIPDPLKALGWEVAGASGAKNEGWKNFLAEIENGPHKNEQLGQVWVREGANWRVKKYHVFMIPDEASRDLAIRAKGSGSLTVYVRDNKRGSYAGRLVDNAGRARIEIGEKILREYRLPSDADGSKMSTIELRAGGDTLTLLVDDVELGSVQDASLTPGGLFGVTAGEGSLVEKVEYQFLDMASKKFAATEPSAPAPNPPDAKSSAEAKKRLVEARAHLKAGEAAETRKLVEEALATAPGDLGVMADAALILAEAQAPERASLLAGEFVKQAPAEHPQFAAITELRVKLAPTLKQYQAQLEGAAKLVTANDDAGEQRELQNALKLVPDGREAAARLEKNPLKVGRPLPGRRWAGALGHTYVPVDDLPNVLFSTWETRVKDFEQFVKETGHDMSQPRSSDKALTWQKPGFEQTGDHPVVMVSRDDAESFCRWLTDKERKAGRLLPGQVYRLPTDREWSAAMGVLNEPGDFPAFRKFPTDVFTWPKDTHPAHNAENLNWKNDDFPNTAPVGSGKPNRFGLYDLLGNVQELCADPWDFTWANGTMRGNSYRNIGTVALRELLADRDGNRYYGRPYCGFRCVLDLKSESQRQMQIAFEQAWQKFCDAGKPNELPIRRRARAVVNDEMILLDLSGANWSSEKTLSYFADLPVTHLYAEGGNMTGAMQITKKWPLRVLSLHTLLGVKADFLESFRGLPLEWINLNLNSQASGIGTQKNLDALRGMKLKGLWLWNFTQLESIEPLRGMPVETLSLMESTVRVDLSPLKDAPLRDVQISKQATLSDIFQACEWWGGTAARLSAPVHEALTAALREPVMAGNSAGVQKLVSEVETRMKTIPYFTQGKASEWMTAAISEHLRFATAAAKWLAGDRSALDGLAQSFNGHTYLSVPLDLNYADAKAFAEKLGAHLVTITTPEESAFLSQARESKKLNGVRIGLERTGEGRMAWKWVTGEPLGYHYWGSNSGQSGDAAGLQNHGGGNWNWWHWGKGDLMSSIIEWDTPTPQPPVKK
jgi:serine/threonine protein kinase